MSNEFDEKIDQKSYTAIKNGGISEKPQAEASDSDGGFLSDEVDEKRSYTP